MYHLNWLGFIVLLVATKSVEIVVELLLTKFWQRILSEERLYELITTLKLRIFILYLQKLLANNPPNILPQNDEQREGEDHL